MFLNTLTRKCAPICSRRQIAATRSLWKVYNVQSVKEFVGRVNNGQPVIVDFFATLCKPCKTLITPRIESAIHEISGNIDVLKVNVDEHGELALSYDVSSVPVLIVMKDGKEVKRMVGLQDIEKLGSLVWNTK